MRYDVFFIDHGDEIFSTGTLEAGDDRHAVEIARQLFRSGIGRGYEIWRRNRCVHQERPSSRSPDHARPRRNAAPLHDYTLRLFNDVGRMLAVLDMQASSDDEAAVAAAMVFDACSDLCAQYEIWSGTVRIATIGIPMRPLTATDVNSHTQQIVADRAQALRDSRCSISQSRRLRRALDEWLGATPLAPAPLIR